MRGKRYTTDAERQQAKRNASQQYYNKPEVQDKLRNERIALKREAMIAYGSCCQCCGESALEFLTLDHINNDGAKQRRVSGGHNTGSTFYRKLKKLGWPPGLQVLCWNCNCAKGHFGYCPHGGV